MKPRHQVSQAALDLVKQFEGYRRSSIMVGEGRWTIGYGHTLTAREGVSISEADAEALLIYDLMTAANLVADLTFTPLSQNQFDALSAFAFSIGAENFRSSNVLRLVNGGQILQAAYAMEAWRMTAFEGEDVVVDALIRRRSAEKTLFLTPVEGFVAAPSAVLSPRLDPEAVFASPVDLSVDEAGVVLLPAQEPVEVEAAPSDYAPPAQADVADAGDGPNVTAHPVVAQEPLFPIPGFTSTAEIPVNPAPALSLGQLFMIAGAGIVLLIICLLAALYVPRAEGNSAVVAQAVAAATGLIGTVGLFSAVYLILNRLDQPS